MPRHSDHTDAPLTGASLVDDVLTRYPAAAQVFVAHRMHCVGCDLARFESLQSAARLYGVSPARLVMEIRAVIAGEPGDPTSHSVPSLRRRKDEPALAPYNQGRTEKGHPV